MVGLRQLVAVVGLEWLGLEWVGLGRRLVALVGLEQLVAVELGRLARIWLGLA